VHIARNEFVAPRNSDFFNIKHTLTQPNYMTSMSMPVLCH